MRTARRRAIAETWYSVVSMPTHVVVQTAFDFDTALPRDRMVMTPCFRWDDLTPQDAESLANNVLDAFEANFTDAAGTRSEARVYDLEGARPVFPMAEVVRHEGLLAVNDRPRELACCLSFAGGQRQPRQRGRIYLPSKFVTSAVTLRPSNDALSRAVEFGADLHDVGGINVNWIVWSRRAQAATGVDYCWSDNEWDIQRRRGLRPTSRDQRSFGPIG